ncbi:MAG: exodeoxyribonuclease VII large subunit [Verrucomicrobia bacterium RIFCSPLOWO2_12_FULL_64_8]|nr:MAG: exodeoxyribonuclease VII large subunit [Verrucomicrobia bacterium RIFCSPLOWO2_12_FULL_64_8]
MKAREETLFGEAGAGVETVSEFTRRVKSLLEEHIRPCWVRGEVSNLRAQPSGHVYFSLKDAGAQLACVLFRGDAARQSVQLRDGRQVLAYGGVGVYEARGQYQLIVRALMEDGIGRLQQEFEKLKQRLADEGLFAAERKTPIPPMPATVGFVTSPAGAAVQDFIRILERRGWSGRLVVLPAKVQGEGAAAEMIEMLQLAESLGIFDLLVIGRGGGSLEDLWAFNEEPLVRAVAACAVPIISAVGHEIDFTLCDFAADLRAETPSAAAELISSNFISHAERAARAAAVIGELAAGAIERAGERLDHARSRLRLLSPQTLVEQSHLRLDDLANRLGAALRAGTQARRQQFTVLAGRLRAQSPETRLRFESHRLLGLGKRLQAASPRSVLHRGFAIVRDDQGHPVPRRAEVKSGQRLVNEFADGRVNVRAE